MTKREPAAPPQSLLFALYAKILLVYPSKFRRQYREQMLLAIRDARDALRSGDFRIGPLRFWILAFLDVLHSAPKEHLRMLRQRMTKQPILFHALVLGLMLTLLGGFGAAVVQNMLRGGADQPQIQMADFYAAEIASGEAPADAIPPGYVDLDRSLEPFVVFYNDAGKPEKSTGYLNQAAPTPPSGVFAYLRAHGNDRITWQPKAGVRVAAIAKRVAGPHPGFLLVGRSLRVVEEQEASLLRVEIFGWLAVVLLLAGGATYLARSADPTPSRL